LQGAALAANPGARARVSELRAKGYDIEKSTVKDEYGFVFHRLTMTQQLSASDVAEHDWAALYA